MVKQRWFRSALIRTALSGLFVTLSCGSMHLSAQEAAPVAPAAVQADPATIARISADLQTLSSDQMEGRGVDTKGIIAAGEFIAARFQDLKFKTDLFDGTPFQPFSIQGGFEVGPAEHNLLKFTRPAANGEVERVELELGKNFTPLALGKNGVFSGGVVFCGYGITAKDINYDDFANIDVTGKVVILLRKEPRQNDPQSPFDGTQPSQYSFFTAKEANAAFHKAAAVIFVNDQLTVDAGAASVRTQIDTSLQNLENLRKKWTSPEASTPEGMAKIRGELRSELANLQAAEIKLDQSSDNLLDANGAGRALSDDRVPTYFCTRAAIDPLLQSSLGQSLAQLEKDIDADLRPRTVELSGWNAEGEAKIEQQDIKARNVIAVFPGQGELAKEYVVVGAHYDHVGFGGMGSLAPGTIAVHNGADDNASGTVTMLEVARRLSQSTAPNRRTVVFMAFSGEERGLLGSAHYCRSPRFPLEDTVAMVNMDMVGRLTDEELTIYGTGSAREFDSLIDGLNSKYQFRLTKDPAGRGPSDHASFFEKKIPVFHFFTGLHNDYHRPSDDFDKINLTGMARISDMVTEVVEKLSVEGARPTFVDVKGVADVGNRRPRPVLGIQLSTEAAKEGDPKGALINEVVAEGAAAKAGLKAGDRVVSVAGKAIEKSTDVAAALSGKRPGDKVTVVVSREGQEVSVEAVLGRAP